MIIFKIKVVGVVFEINAFYESTKDYCSDFLSEGKTDYKIALTKEDLENELSVNGNNQVYVNEEISALYRKIAEVLVDKNIIVFHGSSFAVNGKGFVLTAKSGVGKSTHARFLKDAIGEGFTYINDDKPLIKVSENNVEIYSNPWNGKERRGNNISAPLRAIIFLNRGKENSFRKINNNEETYIKLLSQIYFPKDKSKLESTLKVADLLLKNINFYEINVTKELESAKMTYKEIIQNEIK